MITLVTGGARSGKSRHALELAGSPRPKAFIATAQAIDVEMQQRIDAHRRERDASFLTVEAPHDLAHAIADLPGDIQGAVVDCLTVWLGNLVHLASTAGTDDKALSQLTTFPEIADLLDLLDQPPAVDLILVTNEVGMGIVPASPMGRAFRDLAGALNQAVAARADRVILMVSGLPMPVRG
ncbi:MAG: bifunctional adenosylcobinamide kinase/adenosylcobinamide-phosphate guanylyltransferase [Acidobacteriota bacterium]